MKSIDFSLSFTAKHVEATTNVVIAESDSIVQKILSNTEYNFVNTMTPYHHSESLAAEWSCKLVLASMVHTEKSVRDMATTCKGNLKEWFENRYSNTELFEAIKKVEGDGSLTQAQKHLLRVTLACFKRNGVHLKQAERKELITLKSEISKKEYEFQSNLGEDLSSITFFKDELLGCPEDFINGLDRTNEGKFIVTCKPPHVRAVVENCKIEATRKSIVKLSHSRCKDENAKLLMDLVKLRSKAAGILGFKSWADYKLQGTMAESPDSVWKMLFKLHQALGTRLKDDIEKLTKEKQAKLGLWDLSFYEKLFLQKNLGIDSNLVKTYLPMQFCVRRIMSFYEYLFQIEFKEVKDVPKWHPDVYSFSVSDAKNGNELGYLFLDLFARPGKYAHQCVIPLSPGTLVDNVPIVANISNLSSKGDENNPALLAHGELITFFHEFGHAVHALVGKQEFPIYSWSWKAVPYEAGVEIDFLEVPSKGFEFFAWETDVLQRVTCDFKHVKTAALERSSLAEIPQPTSHPLPNELIMKIQSSKYAFAGYDYERMIFMTCFDMLVHSIPCDGSPAHFCKEAQNLLPKDVQNVTFNDLTVDNMLKWWTYLQKSFVLMETIPETNPLANWYHLAMGYDAGYYGYLWSETVAADIFKSIFMNNITRESGMKLRSLVLSKEASSPAINMLQNLLNRKPNEEALIGMICQ